MTTDTLLAIKVDVDTERGTRLGVPQLLELFAELGIRATFLFALGPDNTGRALRRVFRPGFFGKVVRTSVLSTYGIRTLLNGVLWPGPHIGRRHEALMRSVRDAGHEVGIHCYDHVRWQDGLAGMSLHDVREEFGRARREFQRIFGVPAPTAGAAGWQANANSLEVYDEAGLDYASDARGSAAFYPRVAGRVFRTLQIPTTLPTLDELLGRPEFPEAELVNHYLSQLQTGRLNVLTAHAEIEGMSKRALCADFLRRAAHSGVRFVRLDEIAQVLRAAATVQICELVQGTVDGRSGTLAVQQCEASADNFSAALV